MLTGPVHSGKTTLLRKLLLGPPPRVSPVSGYLSLSVINQGKLAGYDLFLLKDGESMPFLRREGEAGWQKVGPYFFLPRGLEAASTAILGCKPGEILVVDEVGPAELAGRGVWPVLTEALEKPLLGCLLVVRKQLLDDLRRHLVRTRVRVFDIEGEDVYRSLLQALSKEKVGAPAPGRNDAAAQRRRGRR